MKTKETRMRTSVVKKTLLLSMLLAASSAWAGWVKVAQNNDADFYFDPKTVRKDGNLRKVWQIQDLKQRSKDGVMSRRMRFEYDCDQERYRVMSFSSHSKRMADGDVLVQSENETQWQDIAPGTTSDSALKVVCAQ